MNETIRLRQGYDGQAENTEKKLNYKECLGHKEILSFECLPQRRGDTEKNIKIINNELNEISEKKTLKT